MEIVSKNVVYHALAMVKEAENYCFTLSTVRDTIIAIVVIIHGFFLLVCSLGVWVLLFFFLRQDFSG